MFKVTGLPYKLVSLRLIPSVRIFLVFLILILCGSANAQKNYYVSSQGDDSNPGTSESSAWKTIAKVNSVNFLPGDIVNFKGGQEFFDSELLCKSGVIYTSFGTEKAIIGNPKSTSIALTIRVSDKDNVTIKNLKVWGSRYNGSQYGIAVTNSSNVIIDNCEIRGGELSRTNDAGIVFNKKVSGYNRINNCTIRNFAEGMRIYADAQSWLTGLDSLILEYNDVDSCYEKTYDGGLVPHGERDGIRITSATPVEWGYRCVVRYNEVQNWVEEALDMVGGSNIIVEYNNFHHNYRGDDYVAPETGVIKCGSSGSHGTIIRYNHLYDVAGSYEMRCFNLENLADISIYYNLVYDIAGRGYRTSAVSDTAYNNPAYAVKLYNNTIISDSIGVLDAAPRKLWMKNNIIITKHTSNFNYYGQGFATVGSNIFNKSGVYIGTTTKADAAIWHKYRAIDTSSTNYYGQNPNTIFVDYTGRDFRLSSNITGEDLDLPNKDFEGNPIDTNYPTIGCYENVIGASGTSDGINVNTRIWLQGPFYNDNMLPLLHEESYIPLNQNFSSTPWNYNGNESVSSVPNGIVDWVLLELRTGTAGSTTVARKALFLKSDGSVVDLDGISKPSFGELSTGNYYLVLRHRNHLDIMSANPVSLSSNSSLYDFTTSPDKAYGSDPLSDLGNGMWGMYAGDGDHNGIVNIIDYGTVGNFLLQTGYKSGDLDLNGVINVLDYSKTNSNLFRNSQVPN